MQGFDAHRVTEKDNVAVVIRDLAEGETAAVHMGTEILKITAATAVPAGHKIALAALRREDPILKYGEVIGRASAEIPLGAHVHVHNLEGLRGRGDKL